MRVAHRAVGKVYNVAYGYDNANRQTTVTDWLNKATTYGYDDAGRLNASAFPNGVASAYGYDTAGRLTGVTHSKAGTPLASVGYTLDDAGNRLTETAAGVPGAGTTTYTYDPLNRLATAAYPGGGTAGWGYDPVGNRTRATTNGVDAFAAYDPANRLCWDGGATSGACASAPSGATTYTNDNAGNRTGKTVGGATTSYAYDAANRLKTVTAGGSTTATYTYDGDGYRVRKVVGAATSTYAWDRLGAGGLGTVVGDGAAEYVFGPTGLQQRTAGAASQYAQGDGLGSVRLITDGAGNAAGGATFGAWGTPQAGSASLGGFGFTGEQTDAETGLVYLRARSYDPATGRFVQQDPLGQAGGSNLYLYAGDNPIMFTDPSGLFPTVPVVACVSGGAAGAVIGLLGALIVATGTGGIGAGAAPAIIAGGAVGGCALGAGLAVAGQNVYNSRSATPAASTPMPTPTCTPTPTPRTNAQGNRIPDPPPGYTPAGFGKFMQWGQGSDVPRSLIGRPDLTKEYYTQGGLTLEKAKEWRDFYRSVTNNPTFNNSAPGRADYMDWVVTVLGGSSDGKNPVSP